MENKNVMDELKNLTKMEVMAPLKYYLDIKSVDNSAKWNEINKCSLCLCELYDDIIDNEDEKDLEIRY
jgi:hypothetical protein